MKPTGIYRIVNINSNTFYYGKAVNLTKRRQSHFNALRKNRHFNLHLQKAFNKYGENNFKFEIILYCEEFELSRYEEFFIKDKSDKIYNICRESSVTTSGIKYTKEQRRKLSKINKGSGNPMYGKTHTNETKSKMSEKAFLKNGMRGKILNEEQRKRLSDICRGEKNGRAKLTLLDVHWIRESGKDYSLKELSKMFNVCSTTISNIRANKSWKEGADHSRWSIRQNGGIA